MAALTEPRAFRVMSKPTGAICNRDCEYCFFLGKDELYPGSGSGCRPTCTRPTSPSCSPPRASRSNPEGEPGLHYLCAGYQDFFHHVDGPMRVMASLLRPGRDATGLRDWYAVRDARRAPGEPCTCAGGLPFGACHGALTS